MTGLAGRGGGAERAPGVPAGGELGIEVDRGRFGGQAGQQIRGDAGLDLGAQALAERHAELVGDDEVDVLDLLDPVGRYPDEVVGQRGEPPAGRAGERKHGRPGPPGHLGGREDVRGVAAGADRDDEVARPDERQELLGEDPVVARVVAPGGEERDVVGQRHDAEVRHAGDARPLGEVAGEVRGGRGAASVTQGEDGRAAPEGVEQEVGGAGERSERGTGQGYVKLAAVALEVGTQVVHGSLLSWGDVSLHSSERPGCRGRARRPAPSR